MNDDKLVEFGEGYILRFTLVEFVEIPDVLSLLFSSAEEKWRAAVLAAEGVTELVSQHIFETLHLICSP